MRRHDVSLGPDVVALLLPHRRPFLMVDRIDAWDRETLRASRFVSANEQVFAGHFPGLHLWPGVFTIEGLGQSCNLLHALAALESQGFGAHEVRLGLEELELSYRLRASRTERATRLLDALTADPLSRLGLSARVDVKLLEPVFAGQRLDYEVTRTHVVEELGRFEVEATVDGRPVARGVMTGALGVLGRERP